jgi:hypothetical protein
MKKAVPCTVTYRAQFFSLSLQIVSTEIIKKAIFILDLKSINDTIYSVV